MTWILSYILKFIYLLIFIIFFVKIKIFWKKNEKFIIKITFLILEKVLSLVTDFGDWSWLCSIYFFLFKKISNEINNVAFSSEVISYLIFIPTDEYGLVVTLIQNIKLINVVSDISVSSTLGVQYTVYGVASLYHPSSLFYMQNRNTIECTMCCVCYPLSRYIKKSRVVKISEYLTPRFYILLTS